MRLRHFAAPASLLVLAGAGLAAAPAHASTAESAHASVTSAYCQFSDGAAAEIDATWFDGGQAVFEQVYRTASGGGDLEVTYNHKGAARGSGGLPVTWYVSSSGALAVEITDDLGAQCYRTLR